MLSSYDIYKLNCLYFDKKFYVYRFNHLYYKLLLQIQNFFLFKNSLPLILIWIFLFLHNRVDLYIS